MAGKGKPGRPRKEHRMVSPMTEKHDAALREVVDALVDQPPIADPTPLRNVEEVTAAVERDATPALEPHPSDREASREARTETRHGTGRRERKPLGVPRQRLDAKVPTGMTPRWMNDTPGRIQRALEGGYEFISSDGEVVQNRDGCRSEIVGTGRDGGAMKAFLMAIPTVYYEQDQAAKASKIKAVEDAIKRGEPQQAASEDQGQFYTPLEGISLRHTMVDR